MRPLHLQMQAFGAFAGHETLDFAALGAHRLFLIAGPTGAGKTTLLDAICFALYGASSGDERTAEQLRSQHAPIELPTEVTLDFALGPRCYRVTRSPRQERPKRGGGTTLAQAGATLWALSDADAATPENPDSRVLATGWSKVTAAVEDLVGFRGEQFRQVIMLPQGRFRDLLVAPVGERERILETLFQTQVYSRIQAALKERASAIRREMEALEVERRTLFGRIECSDEAALDAHLLALATQDAALTAQVTAAKLAEQAAMAALRAGQDAAARRQTQALAQAALEAITTQNPAIDAHRGELTLARRAAGLADLHAQWQGRAAELARLAAEVATATAASAHAQAADARAQAGWTAEQARTPARAALASQLTQLQGLADLVTALAAAETDLLKRAHAGEAANAVAGQTAARLADQRRVQEQASAERERLQPVALQVDLLTAQTEDLIRLLGQRQQFDQGQLERAHLAGQAQAAATALATADVRLQAARDHLEGLQQRWNAGQAQVLAAGLTPGHPCPVCGAADHPTPAQPIADAPVPTEARLNAAKTAVTQADQARTQAATALAGYKEQLAARDSALTVIAAALGDWAGQNATALDQALATRRQALAAAQAAASALATLDAAAPARAAALTTAEAAASAAAGAHQQAAEALAVARQSRDERAKLVPAPWQVAGALAEAVAARTAELASAEAAVTAARQAAERTATARASAQAAAAAVAQQHQHAGEALATLAAQWIARRMEAGFADDVAFAAAQRSPDQRTALEAAISAHAQALTAARTTLDNATSAAAGLLAPDLLALTECASAATTAREQQEAARVDGAAQQRQLSALRGAIATNAAALAAGHANYGVAGRLADVANSANPYKLSFQRFVLAALLDDVLIAASLRLRAMSRGRYQLLRQQAQADQRSLGGLELLVEDGYTGKTRPVATLSGGEGFQAALSLALGLAEVVQAHAGGMRLDAIFIDEGFGSLDPEALELAIDTLVDLQQSGRLVGIISHVPELAARIHARLEVIPGRAGSRARFV